MLLRRRKNNPVFVGEAGVGKTALAEGLALAIHEGEVPAALKGVEIYALDMGALLAGHALSRRLRAAPEGASSRRSSGNPEVVLFIDEIHTIVGAGSASGSTMDASNLLKPALASGELRCIGSTTYQEYKRSFDRDKALARRFQRIDVPEPTARRGGADSERAQELLRKASQRALHRAGASRRGRTCRRATSTIATCPTRRST